MKMQAFKLQNLFLATAMIAMASCSDSVIEGIDPEANPLDDYVTDVKLNVEDFEYVGDGTRTSYDLNWDTYEGYTTFSWTKGDKVGVMPIREYGDPWPSTMVAYTIESKDDAKGAEATFDGRGWQLKNNVKYTALYPYSYTFNDPETMDYEFFQVSFQGQRQIGNNSRSHLGKYDFMAAAPVQSENGSLHFNFKHLATLCEFNIYAKEKRTFTKMELKFRTNTNYILKIPVDAAIVGYQSSYPYLYTFNKKQSFVMDLQDVVTGSDGYVNIFAMLPPDIFSHTSSYSDIDLTLYDNYGYAINFICPYNYVSSPAGKYLNLKFVNTTSGYEKTEAHLITENFSDLLKSAVNPEFVKSVVFESGRYLDESYNIDLSASDEIYKVKAKFDPGIGKYTIATNASRISITDCSDLFRLYTALERVDSLCVLNTSKVTTMSYMFSACHSLRTVSFAGIDTRNVRDFSNMFNQCESLEEIDLSEFQNLKATNFSYMFDNCLNLKNIYLGKGFVRDVKEPVTLEGMFRMCRKLNLVDGTFNTSSVTNMSHMFYMAAHDNFGSNYIHHLVENSSFDTSNVEDMSYMFYSCRVDNLIIDNFRTDKLLNVECMFYDSSIMTLHMNEATFENVTNFNKMFMGTNRLYTLQITSMIFDPTKATYDDMFYNYAWDYRTRYMPSVIHANLQMKDFFTESQYTEKTSLHPNTVNFYWYQ